MSFVSRRQLFICPHPDDELLLFGGKLLEGSPSNKVVLIVAGGDQSRTEESRAFLRQIGIGEYWILDLPELFVFSDWAVKNFHRALASTARKPFNETFIPCFEGGHIDHDSVSFLVQCATSPDVRRSLGQLFEMPGYRLVDGVPEWASFEPGDEGVTCRSTLSMEKLRGLLHEYFSQAWKFENLREYGLRYRPARTPQFLFFSQLTYAEAVLGQDYDAFIRRVNQISRCTRVDEAPNRRVLPRSQIEDLDFKLAMIDGVLGHTTIRGSTINCRVRFGGESYFFKHNLFRQPIRGEVCSSTAVRRLGIATPEVVGVLKSGLGALFRLVPGDRPTMQNMSEVESLARLVARLHALEDPLFEWRPYAPIAAGFPWTNDTGFSGFLRGSFDWLLRIFENRIAPALLAQLKKRIDTVAEEFTKAGISPSGVIVHGDLADHNLLWGQDGNLQLVDWSNAGRFDHLYELAHLSLSECFLETPEFFGRFIKIYRDLSPHDIPSDSGEFRLFRAANSLLMATVLAGSRMLRQGSPQEAHLMRLLEFAGIDRDLRND